MKETNLIVCRVSLWYLRRMALIMALTGGLGLLFFYDGQVGYPAKNHIADLHSVFEATASGGTAALAANRKTRSEKQESELQEAREAALGGASWAGFAAGRLLAEEKPKRYSREEIREQFVFAILMGGVTLAFALFCWLRRGRTIQGDGEAIIFPDGRRVRFDDIHEIDLRKWDRGIARIAYTGGDGGERIATVDDYKYTGTKAILNRAREKNSAILIEGDIRWLALAGRSSEAGQGAEKE